MQGLIWLVCVILLNVAFATTVTETVEVTNEAGFLAAVANAKDGTLTRILLKNNITMNYVQPLMITGTKSISIGNAIDVASTLNIVAPRSITIPSAIETSYANILYAVGDLNGDGSNDFASNTASDTWTVVFGGSSGSVPDASTQKRIFAIGDINGDFMDDFAFAVADANNQFEVRIILGGQNLTNSDSAVKQVVISIESTYLIRDVVGIGDVNGDGINDFVISYARDPFEPGAANFKALFLVLGSRSMGQTNATSISFIDPYAFACEAQTLVPSETTSFSRLSVAGAGDIDFDGFEDFLVGIPPSVYFVYGGPGLETRLFPFDRRDLNVVFSSVSTSTFGGAVAGGKDLNGDGHNDFVIGAPDTSEVIVLFGGAFRKNPYEFSTLLQADYKTLDHLVIFGKDGCGAAVVVEDYDLDGLADLLIHCSLVSSTTRRAFLVFGEDLNPRREQQPTPGARFNISEIGMELKFDQSGKKVEGFEGSAGDIDGDGYPDVLLFDSTKSFLVSSPGKARSQLKRTPGLFTLNGTASLSFGSVKVEGTKRLFTNQGSGSVTILPNSSFASDENSRAQAKICPIIGTDDGTVCPVCASASSGSSASLANMCPTTCDELFTSRPVLGEMQTRFEFNFAGPRVAYGGDMQLVAYFDPVTRFLLANRIVLGDDTCGIEAMKSRVSRVPLATFYVPFSVSANRYDGSSALMFDILSLTNDGTFLAIYLGADSTLYASKMNKESGLFDEHVVVHAFNASEVPPEQSMTVYTFSCSAGPTAVSCFLSFYRRTSRTYVQYLFKGDASGQNWEAMRIGNSNKVYPSNQLEIWTLLPSPTNSIKGEAFFESRVRSDGSVLLVYYAREATTNAIGRSSLMFSVFDSSMTAVKDRLTIASFNGEVITGMRLIGNSGSDYLLVHSWALKSLLLYQFNGEDTWTRIVGDITAPGVNIHLPTSFDFAFIPKKKQDEMDSLLILYASNSTTSTVMRRIDVNRTSGRAAAIALGTISTPNFDLSKAMSFHRRMWIKPDLSSFSYSQLLGDPLSAVQRRAARMTLFSSDINSHLISNPWSPFPVSQRIFSERIPVLSELMNARGPPIPPVQCPVGFYCLKGSVLPCPTGSFQTLSGKTSLDECETENTCREGFWCGSGAANGTTYRRVIQPSLDQITMEMLVTTSRYVIWEVKNVDSQSSARIRLVQGMPDWMSSRSLVNGNSTGGEYLFLREGFGYAIPPLSSLQFNLTIDGSKIPRDIESIEALLTFEWWLPGQAARSEDVPQQPMRFNLALPFKITFVPLLVSPQSFSLSMKLGDTVEDVATLFNVFPTSIVTATVVSGCGSAPASWFSFAKDSIVSEQRRLLPGLGQSFPVRFVVDSSRADLQSLGSPLEPVKPLQTCFRFKCNVDGVQIVADVNISTEIAQRCPPNHFSSTGINSPLSSCVPCPEDHFQPTPGSTACLLAPKCPRGTFSNQNGRDYNESSCQPCGPGTFGPEEGALTCRPCPPGQFEDRNASVECLRCPETLLGAKRDGAKSEMECEASVGYFKVVNGSRALGEPCPIGVDCSSEASLESLPLVAGFWRSTLNSTIVRKCRKSHYCVGLEPPRQQQRRLLQETISSSDVYCRDDHVGVLCEGCPEGYAKRGADRVCTQCNASIVEHDQGALAGVLIVILLVPTLGFIMLILYQKRSRSAGTVKVKAASRLYACMKLVDGGTKPKLLIGLFQVVAACVVNFDLSFPPQFASLASSFTIFYIDTNIVIDMGCAFAIASKAWYKTLLVTTIAPFIAIVVVFLLNQLVLWLTGAKGNEEKTKQINAVTAAICMFTMFLVYPGVSNTIIRTFICETFDDGRRVLKADYSVECNDVWQNYVVYAAIMCVVYVVGIPVSFAFILLRRRKALNPNKSGPKWDQDAQLAAQLRDENPDTRPLFFLIHAYVPFFFWFEPLDLVIRLLQTSVILVLTEVWQQILFLLCVTVAYLLLLVQLAPYVKWTNHVLALSCQLSILVISLAALIYTLDKTKTSNVGVDVVCILALFFPVAIALPLHVFQIRHNRWSGFFDAQEPEDDDDDIVEVKKKLASSNGAHLPRRPVSSALSRRPNVAPMDDIEPEPEFRSSSAIPIDDAAVALDSSGAVTADEEDRVKATSEATVPKSVPQSAVEVDADTPPFETPELRAESTNVVVEVREASTAMEEIESSSRTRLTSLEKTESGEERASARQKRKQVALARESEDVDEREGGDDDAGRGDQDDDDGRLQLV